MSVKEHVRDGLRRYLATTRHRPLLRGGCQHTWRNRTQPIIAQCDVEAVVREVARLLDEAEPDAVDVPA